MSSAGHEMDGGIKVYLREIGKTDLLTPEQELELAERIKVGDPEARSHMIRANLRLVVKIAQDYANYGLPLLDLISEGNIGLMKAVERFDPNKGGKLSTYAAWWIKQSIKRALANQSKTIRLPVHMVDKISKMRRVAMSMAEELGREPTDDELSEEIGIDRAKISQLKVASMRPASLDAPVSAEDDTEFGEIVRDENAIDPATQAAMNNALGQVPGLLQVLDERELKIISARFGLDGQRARTLEEVGQEFGVTRERIRQLQNIALRKLRRALQKREDPIPKALRGARSNNGKMKTNAGVKDVHSLSFHQKKKSKEKPAVPSGKTKHHHVIDDKPVPEEPVAEPEEPVAEPEEPVAEPEEPVPVLGISKGSFIYSHSDDDCQLARSFWGIPNVTVHHCIGQIWRCMAPYSLGKVVQILIQAGCIQPEYAVRVLTHGDKAERVKSHIPSCTAEMLGVSLAEVEKLLQ